MLEDDDFDVSGWIGQDCVRHTQGEICMGCGRGCPVAPNTSNQPGSYFGIIQGDNGFSAIPKSIALVSFFVNVLMFVPAYGPRIC